MTTNTKEVLKQVTYLTDAEEVVFNAAEDFLSDDERVDNVLEVYKAAIKNGSNSKTKAARKRYARMKMYDAEPAAKIALGLSAPSNPYENAPRHLIAAAKSLSAQLAGISRTTPFKRKAVAAREATIDDPLVGEVGHTMSSNDNNNEINYVSVQRNTPETQAELVVKMREWFASDLTGSNFFPNADFLAFFTDLSDSQVAKAVYLLRKEGYVLEYSRTNCQYTVVEIPDDRLEEISAIETEIEKLRERLDALL